MKFALIVVITLLAGALAAATTDSPSAAPNSASEGADASQATVPAKIGLPNLRPCKQLCIKGTVCQNGQCVRNLNSCAATTCPTGYKCVNGDCIDSCVTFLCPPPLRCIKGVCAVQGPPPPDKCLTIKCPPGLICINGRCTDTCAAVTCPANSVCKDGKCSPRPPTNCNECVAKPGMACPMWVCATPLASTTIPAA